MLIGQEEVSTLISGTGPVEPRAWAREELREGLENKLKWPQPVPVRAEEVTEPAAQRSHDGGRDGTNLTFCEIMVTRYVIKYHLL